MSPFQWRLIARTSSGFEVRQVNVLGERRHDRVPQAHEPRRRSVVAYRSSWTPPVFGASETRTAKVFLGFSRFPAVRVLTNPDGIVTVQWTDLRFVEDLRYGGLGRRERGFFTATVRLDAAGVVLEERMGP